MLHVSHDFEYHITKLFIKEIKIIINKEFSSI